jgi:hypothetical protein
MAIGSRQPATRTARNSYHPVRQVLRVSRRLPPYVGKDENAVGHADAGKTVGDQDRRFAFTQFLEAPGLRPAAARAPAAS